jgi:hydroxymethylglutaryl-CoA reductase (NADPH)
MFGFLTSRWQSATPQAKTTPTWFAHSISPILLSVAKKACTHPIHTIVTIALLGSYSYLGVLDKGLLDTEDARTGRVDLQTLLAGSKQLRVGAETNWQWQVEETSAAAEARELAVVTLVFPESSAINSAPSHNAVPTNVSVERLPSSSSSFSTLSQDTSLVYSVPYADAADFLRAMQEISAPADVADAHGSDNEGTREEKKWMMRASKNANGWGGVRNWANDSWTSFVDLLKVRRSANTHTRESR